MALLGFTLPPDSGEKLTLGRRLNNKYSPWTFLISDKEHRCDIIELSLFLYPFMRSKDKTQIDDKIGN